MESNDKITRSYTMKNDRRGIPENRPGRARPAGEPAARAHPRRERLLPVHALVLCVVPVLLLSAMACAQEMPDSFSTGPAIENFGPVADMPASAFNLVPGTKYKVLLEVSSGDKEKHELNRRLESAARFINMHARAGIDPADLDVEVVTHGGATWDVLSDAAYRKRFGRDNPNTPLLEALGKSGVRIYECGQSMAYYGVTPDDLAPQVTLAVSAMTVMVRRQQEGWALLP